MFGALRDCVVPMKCVRHYESPQTLLDAFDKEITQNFAEVNKSFSFISQAIVPSKTSLELGLTKGQVACLTGLQSLQPYC